MNVIVEKLSELHGDGSQTDYFLFFEQGHMAKPLLVINQYDMERIFKEHSRHWKLLLSFILSVSTIDLRVCVNRLMELMKLDIEWDDWSHLHDELTEIGVKDLWHDSYSQ